MHAREMHCQAHRPAAGSRLPSATGRHRPAWPPGRAAGTVPGRASCQPAHAQVRNRTRSQQGVAQAYGLAVYSMDLARLRADPPNPLQQLEASLGPRMRRARALVHPRSWAALSVDGKGWVRRIHTSAFRVPVPQRTTDRSSQTACRVDAHACCMGTVNGTTGRCAGAPRRCGMAANPCAPRWHCRSGDLELVEASAPLGSPGAAAR